MSIQAVSYVSAEFIPTGSMTVSMSLLIGFGGGSIQKTLHVA